MKERLDIAGVPVDPLTFKEAVDVAWRLLNDGGQHLIVTPNPEMAVLADKDESFKRALWSSDLAIADGFGLRLAALLHWRRVPETIPGVDFMLALAIIAARAGAEVYFLGGSEGVAKICAEKLKKQFPQLRVVGAETGGRITWQDSRWFQDEKLNSRLIAAKPDILIAALGHGKQERWLRDHLESLPSVRLAIGVGGAFDFYAGKARRAPQTLRKLHLEWLWRLIVEPRRWKRIFTAVIVFPVMALKRRLKRVK